MTPLLLLPAQPGRSLTPGGAEFAAVRASEQFGAGAQGRRQGREQGSGSLGVPGAKHPLSHHLMFGDLLAAGHIPGVSRLSVGTKTGAGNLNAG